MDVFRVKATRKLLYMALYRPTAVPKVGSPRSIVEVGTCN